MVKSSKVSKAVIVCNGPSLEDIPNEWLEKYPTFASNRIFLKEGFQPDYLAIFDLKMVFTCKLVEDILPSAHAAKHVYFSEDAWPYIEPVMGKKWNNVSILHWKNFHSEDGTLLPVFSSSPLINIVSGGTVTYGLMQLAAWKGYNHLLCVGLDHSFTGPRGDHFSDEYNEPVNIPYAVDYPSDVDEILKTNRECGTWVFSERHYQVKTEGFYKVARSYYKNLGGQIYNLTPDSKLDVFPIMSIEEYEKQYG